MDSFINSRETSGIDASGSEPLDDRADSTRPDVSTRPKVEKGHSMPTKSPKQTPPPTPLPPGFEGRAYLTPVELANILLLGPSTVYKMIADGRIKTLQTGRRRVISVEEYRRIVAEGIEE